MDGSTVWPVSHNTTVDLIHRYVTRLEARDWDGFAVLLHPDVVYRLPQTREVIRGRDGYVRFNREYPDIWHLRLVEAYGDSSGEMSWRAIHRKRDRHIHDPRTATERGQSRDITEV